MVLHNFDSVIQNFQEFSGWIFSKEKSIGEKQLQLTPLHAYNAMSRAVVLVLILSVMATQAIRHPTNPNSKCTRTYDTCLVRGATCETVRGVRSDVCEV